jgi:hypothetical protein
MKVTIVSLLVIGSFATLVFSVALAQILFTLMLISAIVVYAHTIGRYIHERSSR